jgi:diguanylate cyclase (GGDEF)-like protein/PAS domain S-box-containing protein
LWVLYFSVLVTHALAIIVARQYFKNKPGKSWSLAALHFLCACWMLGCIASHQPNLVLASIPAELFLINAILFNRNYALRNPGNLIAVSGFVLWGWSSFLAIGLRHSGIAEALFPPVLNLPKFLVAIGMIMIILEQDAEATREVVREYEVLFEKNPFSLWIYDLKSLRFLSANPASAKVLGYSVAEMREKKVSDIVLQPEATASPDAACDLPPRQDHTLHIRKDGTLVPMNVTTYDVRFRGREARLSLAEDISERENLAAQLMHQVRHDLLTGLPNRTTFLSRLDEIFASAVNDERGCAVIVFHINRFEKLNETYGHGMGDLLLKETARVIQSHLQPGDVLGRTGSREFMVALASVESASAAEALARKLLRIFDEPASIGPRKIIVSACVGLAVYPEDSDNPASLLRDAVRAQAFAQVPGTDSFVRLSRALSRQAQEETRIEGLIQHSLLSGGFEVVYQPILDINAQLCGLEALLRLHDEDGRIISPNIFIPIAESTATIIPLGRWVVRQVCRQLREWQDLGLDIVPVAINASALQIVQTNFCADVMSILAQFDIAPELVHLELTESGVMPQNSLAFDNMLKLSSQGIRFSIDDFGTGFSSLDRLHQLPVSTLKIDRTFVQRMLDPNGTLPIVSTIMSMAHSLNLGVVAEGVETREQFHALYEMGCDQFQGFFFSKPLSAAAATKLFNPERHAMMLVEIEAVTETTIPSPFAPIPAIQTGVQPC